MAKGIKTGGGSRKGCPNKAAVEKAKAVANSGLTPLDYLLSVVRDDKADRPMRIDASKAAAPYVHPRLNNIEHTGKGGGALVLQLMGPDGDL